MSTPGNSINESTTGITGFTGTGFTGTAATQYNVLVGGANSYSVSNIAPSATSGVPVISQGSSANPAFGTAVVAGGGTGLTATTAYAVVCGGTTTTASLQSIASVGTSGQVLTSNGAAALPTFQAAGGGGAWSLIGTGTASNDAGIAFTNLTSTYFVYKVYFHAVIPVTDNVIFRLKTSTDNGSTYDGGGSDYVMSYWSKDVGDVGAFASITINTFGYQMAKECGTGTNETIDGEVTIYNPSDTTFTWISHNIALNDRNAQSTSRAGSGARISAADVDAIQFSFSSGNVSSGTFKLYGLSAT